MITRQVSCYCQRQSGARSVDMWRAGGLLIALTTLFVGGCAESAGTAKPVTLAERFQLGIGESALVAAADIEVGMQNVSNDSRCGKGEVCVWEGDATVVVWMRHPDGQEQRELHTARSQGPAAVTIGAYTVRLVSLLPPAVSGYTIAPDEYVAVLQVTQGIAGSDEVQ